MKDISEKTQMHLRNVYANVMMCTGICAAAMWVNATTILSGWFMQMLLIVGMAYLMFQVMNRYSDEKTRISYLWAVSFLLGFLVGPAIHLIAEVEPMILVQAVSYTAIVFGSFTCIAMFSKRRSYLFLGGIISSIMTCMFWYRTLSWLLGYSYSYNTMNMVYMMIGLFTACLYIIFDTQMIIERAERGDKDVPTHTLTIFMDLFDLFIKILRVLIKLSEENKKKENKNNRN